MDKAFSQTMQSAISRRTLLQGAAAAGAVVTGGRAVTAQAQEADATPKAGGTLTFSYYQKTSFSHFMHMRTYAGGEHIYVRTFAEAKLITRNQEMSEFLPDLAERWEVAPDGTRVTFFLRTGLTWHDGTPFTSADVDFTFHMIGMPGLGTYNSGSAFNDLVVGNKEWIDGGAARIAGLTVVDDLTVAFDLTGAVNQDVLFSAFNQICLAPSHILSEYLDRERGPEILQSEWATTANHVGIGPFKVVEYVPDQHVIYEPFEAYYRGRPLLDQLIYRPFLDAQTNAAALEGKEVDVARLGASEYARFQEFDFLTLITPKAMALTGSPFNTRQPYLTKPVRQALVMAIDREAIIQTLYAGTVDLIPCPISVPKYGDSPNLATYAYDPERAKQLLTEGGWDGSRKIRWAVGEIPADETIYAAINGYWEAIGVQAEYQVMGQELSVMGPPNYDFDLYMSSYPVGLPSDVATHYDPRLATYVSAGYDTPEFVALWDQAKLQQSDEEAQQTIWQLQEILAGECLGLWLSRAVDIWGINQRVHGLSPMYVGNAAYLYDWHLEKVWVDS